MKIKRKKETGTNSWQSLCYNLVMNRIHQLLFIVLFLFFVNSWGKEELVVIQTISSSKKTFVLLKGQKDGVSRGQEVIVSNNNISIVCKAIEVTRELSLWRALDSNISVPFNKQDIVSINTHAFGIVGVDIGGEVTKLIPDDEVNIAYVKVRNDNNIQIKYSYGAALSQSASSIGTSEFSKKKGQDYSFDYGIRLSPAFEIALGLRLDYEIYRLTNPELDIPTDRKFLMTSFTYHLVSYSKNKNNFYATVALGIGNSTTNINSNESTGLATVLPQVRVGYLVPITGATAMVFEASVESIASHEKFASGAEQNTTQINSKIGVGIRF